MKNIKIISQACENANVAAQFNGQLGSIDGYPKSNNFNIGDTVAVLVSQEKLSRKIILAEVLAVKPSVTNPSKGVKVVYKQIAGDVAPFATWQNLVGKKLQKGTAIIDIELLKEYPNVYRAIAV